MGLCDQGVFGAWRNKVGNVVGRVRQGRNVYAIYQPQVANPRTPAQLRYRRIFTAMTQLGRVLLPVLKVGFASLDGYRYGSAYSSFIGFNIKSREAYVYDAQTGVARPKYDKLAVSVGNLPLGVSMVGTLDGSEISATWSDNSGTGTAAAEDVCYMAVYNPTKLSCIYVGTAKRSDRVARIECPAAWSGDTVESWAFFRSEKGECSETWYLGSFNL